MNKEIAVKKTLLVGEEKKHKEMEQKKMVILSKWLKKKINNRKNGKGNREKRKEIATAELK